MAKIPKGRLVLYVVLGIAVVIIAVFVLKARAEEAKKTQGLRVRPHQIVRLSGDMKSKLEHNMEKAAREGITGADDLNARASALIAEFEAAANPDDSNPSDELTAKYKTIMAMIDSIKDMRKAAKGK